MIREPLERSVTGAQYDESKCHFCHLYQKSLNISVSDTSFFPSKPTWEIILTTESLYNHVDLGGRFREKSVHSWKARGQPDSARPALQGHPLFDLAEQRARVQGCSCL